MASVNKVILIGNLGRDPETRYTADGGSAITSVTLATSRYYKDQQGNRQEETEWHRITFFGRQAELVRQYVKKGDPLYVEGRLRTRRFTDKNEQERMVTEIIAETVQFLTSRNRSGEERGSFEPARRPAGGEAPRQAPAPAAEATKEPAGGTVNIGEDIPF